VLDLCRIDEKGLEFQEVRLSRHLLVFNEQQVHFTCRSDLQKLRLRFLKGDPQIAAALRLAVQPHEASLNCAYQYSQHLIHFPPCAPSTRRSRSLSVSLSLLSAPPAQRSVLARCGNNRNVLLSRSFSVLAFMRYSSVARSRQVCIYWLWKHCLFCRDCLREKEIYIHLVYAPYAPMATRPYAPLATPCPPC
jgi:hypothetical protein